MKFGLYLPNFGPFGDARTLAELAAQTEQAGWDGFFIWDHINRKPEYGPVVDPWVALTAAAMRTMRIKLGALVTPLPRRRPWVLARQTASLDHLSGGRLVFAAGIGSGQDFEWGGFGEAVEAKQRAAMLDEGLQVLAGLWSGQPFSFEGRYYRVQPTQFLPPSTQQPRIPVWIGGNWPSQAPLRRAAQWDGAFILFQEQGEEVLAQVANMIEQVRAYRQSHTPSILLPQRMPVSSASGWRADGGMGVMVVETWRPRYRTFEGDWPLE